MRLRHRWRCGSRNRASARTWSAGFRLVVCLACASHAAAFFQAASLLQFHGGQVPFPALPMRGRDAGSRRERIAVDARSADAFVVLRRGCAGTSGASAPAARLRQYCSILAHTSRARSLCAVAACSAHSSARLLKSMSCLCRHGPVLQRVLWTRGVNGFLTGEEAAGRGSRATRSPSSPARPARARRR